MKADFIPGIYNYCDRWCERCTFAKRCRVYTEDLEAKKTKKVDVIHERISTDIEKELKKSFELLQKMVEDREVLGYMEETEEDYIEEQSDNQGNTLKEKGNVYIKLVDEWFKSNKAFFEEREEEISKKIALKLGVDEEALDHINRAFENIRWYQVFISAKIHRSLAGLKLENFEEIHFTQNDSNGSAKVALLAIEQSITSWETIRTYFPEKTDELIDIFVLLHKIQEELKQIFPLAKKFIRPGFDDVFSNF